MAELDDCLVIDAEKTTAGEETATKYRDEAEQIKELSAIAGMMVGGVCRRKRPCEILQEKMETDSRSVYVGNVEYSATHKDLELHFVVCGGIKRITIPQNAYTNHPKGFAYIEFKKIESVQQAVHLLNDSLFKGRQIKVVAKRTNVPYHGFSRQPPKSTRPLKWKQPRSHTRWVAPY